MLSVIAFFEEKKEAIICCGKIVLSNIEIKYLDVRCFALFRVVKLQEQFHSLFIRLIKTTPDSYVYCLTQETLNMVTKCCLKHIQWQKSCYSPQELGQKILVVYVISLF